MLYCVWLFKHCGFPDQPSPIDETDNCDGEEARPLFSQVNSNVSIDDYYEKDTCIKRTSFLLCISSHIFLSYKHQTTL